MGSSNENSGYGPVLNPWDRTRVPGGSAGGSAAAVAAGLAPWALGTDTGGSIRQPAALCGIVGLKPTYGAVSRYGMIAFASSLDQAGPFTRDVTDAALLFSHMVGRDPMRLDRRSAIREPVELPSAERLDGIRLGVPDELAAGEGIEPGVLERFEATLTLARGARRDASRTCSLPHAPHGLSAYYVLAPAEASSNLARFDGVRYGLRVEADDLRLDVHRDAPRRLRRRGQAPHPDRHLRAVERLLRRLLRPRAAGAHEDRARTSRRVFEQRRLRRHADEPRRRVRARRRRPPTRWRCTSTTSARCRCRSPASRRSRSRAGSARACRSASSSPARRSARTALLDAAHALEQAIGFDGSPARDGAAHDRLRARHRPGDPRPAAARARRCSAAAR